MINIDGIEYITGSRVPVAPIREMVKSFKLEESRQLDDDLPDWYQDNDLEEQVGDYMRSNRLIPNKKLIKDIIEEVQV